jgi:Zn-finger nucleic acid-binding protein
MAQRAIRLFFHLHRVMCPNCSVFIEYNTIAEMLPDCEKSCPQCKKVFLVVDGVGKPLKKRPRGTKV